MQFEFRTDFVEISLLTYCYIYSFLSMNEEKGEDTLFVYFIMLGFYSPYLGIHS